MVTAINWQRHSATSPSGAPPSNATPICRPVVPSSGTAIAGRTVHIPDVLQDPEWARADVQSLMGFRAALGVPLLREGNLIGVLILQRFEPGEFTPKQIELVKTFADQAVIAIENARLFDEVQARTRDVTEALEYKPATSEVLNVISRSPNALQPVLDTIVKIAARLCQAEHAFIWKLDDGLFHLAAINEVEAEFAKFAMEHPHTLSRKTVAGRSVLERHTIHIPDVSEDSEYDWHEGQKIGNYRTLLGVPLLCEGRPFGACTIFLRTVRPLVDMEIELVTTFADQ